MKTECVGAQLGALLDGEVEPAEAARVERHLRSCAACRGRWSILVALREAVRDLPREGVSTGFEAAFANRLKGERRALTSSHRRAAVWRPFVLATAATLSLLAVWFAPRVQPPPLARPQPPGSAPAAALLAPANTPGLDCGLDETVPPDTRPCANARSCGTTLTTAPGLPSTLQRRPVCVRAVPRRETQAPSPARRSVSRLNRGSERHA